MKKTFCDICGKEIKDKNYSIVIKRNNEITCKYGGKIEKIFPEEISFDEICPDCKQEIDIIIERLKKE